MKVAIIHYWLVNWRGGEKVLAELLALFPQADLFTHVADPELLERHLHGRRVSTTLIAKLPFARRWYQRYLPLMPYALEQLDLRGYDIVIACESGPAKGVITDPDAVQICYCHSPMRYLWDMYHDYRQDAGRLTRLLMGPLVHYLRMWDQLSAQRVDHFIANSQFVASRIRRYYRRDARVIYPPVACEDFVNGPDQGFYLMVGQLVGYKRADLAIEAFREMKRHRLIVIGEGEQFARLKKSAPSNVKLLGRQPFSSIRRHYMDCRALIFPGVEDFGIVPVEAMASGKPVIAFRGGGALETVVEGVTGLFFDDQTVAAVVDAIGRFEARPELFVPQTIREHAMQFGAARFRAEISSVVDSVRQARLVGANRSHISN